MGGGVVLGLRRSRILGCQPLRAGFILLGGGFRNRVKDLIYFDGFCDEQFETGDACGICNPLLDRVLELFFVFRDHSAFVELENRGEGFEFDGEVAGRALLFESAEVVTNLF